MDESTANQSVTTRGGKRDGAGRKPTGRKKSNVFITEK